MLVLARTMELRDNMAISLIHTLKRRLRFIGVIAGLSLILLPEKGFALQVSTPVGVQEIGKRLNLKSTLSGIPEGAESQLRSTCLRARIKSIETSPSIDQRGNSRDIFVNFQPTIKHGGLIEFTSTEPVNDALLEMELISECPLIVFTSRWTLIMDTNSSPASLEKALVASESVNFDFRNSSLLSASRRTPNPTVQDKSKPRLVDTKMEIETEKPVDLISPPIDGTAQPAKQEAAMDPVIMASLPQDVLSAGLIESQPSPNDRYELENMDRDRPDGLAGFGSIISVDYWPVILASTLLGLLALVYLVKKGSQRSLLKSAVAKRDPVIGAPKPSASEFRDTGFHGDVPKQDTSGYASDRVLESLIASDDSSYEDLLDSDYSLNESDLPDSSIRSSLKISLELINRADIRPWDLPTAYHSMIEQRNKSLQLHRTSDALLLRCHIGLVELAFQDAKQGDTTHAQTALDLLGLVLGEYVYDVDSTSILCVPDVVKSHVRAKMCEITGAEKRQILRENLINLNTQVLSPALCFHTDAWREFLSDEGALT